jgi:hypothetical protein
MIKPQITSRDMLLRFARYNEYSQDPSSYKYATDGVVSGTTLSSATTEFTAAMQGKYICVAGKGYAVISTVTVTHPATHTHSVTLDTAVGAGTGLTVCLGGGTAQERDAFELMKVHMLDGYSVVVDGKIKPLVVGLRELAGKFGTQSTPDPDFHDLVEDTSLRFNESHRACAMFMLFNEQSVQGGERWAKMAAEYFDRYLTHLNAAIATFARQLIVAGDLDEVNQTDRMTFVPLVRE